MRIQTTETFNIEGTLATVHGGPRPQRAVYVDEQNQKSGNDDQPISLAASLKLSADADNKAVDEYNDRYVLDGSDGPVFGELERRCETLGRVVMS